VCFNQHPPETAVIRLWLLPKEESTLLAQHSDFKSLWSGSRFFDINTP